MSSTETNEALAWKVFPTDEHGFLRAPVLVSGETEAILIDGTFGFDHGKTVADAIRAGGKRLKAIYVTTNDPDYYFGLAPVRAAFPDVAILAAPDTVALMHSKAAGKIATWSPVLGKNGPNAVSELIFPTETDQRLLTVDGHELRIVTAPGIKDRGRYIWTPSLRAVFGGVPVFGGMYPWTADLPTAAERKAWVQALDAMLALEPEIVVPGHMTPDWPLDRSGITYTRDYVVAFEQEAAEANDAAALIAAIRRRYPGQAMEKSLELGAKVAKGEITWG